ncbi:MAG: substrate-binding domain-containing protein [Actinobacteria bacterium]|nr:substrate-binding domain-containing protein [Actinomycetota bacterium]
MKFLKLTAVFTLLIFWFSGCVSQKPKEKLILLTTTSTYDSGLLDYLLPDFEKKFKIKVQVISVGTGQALEMGKNGDGDVLLVHSPKDEEKFMKEKHGIKRRWVMYNDFIIVGPKNDPAGIRGDGAKNAFKKISEKQTLFISRGDDSGTHKKELSIWKDISRNDAWYIEAGKGMGDTLMIASEKKGYTLADRGTFVSLKSKLDLEILVEGDKILLNPYGVIAVNPDKNPKINYSAAAKFIDWIMSKEGQTLIANFKKSGEQLFKPLYGKSIRD